MTAPTHLGAPDSAALIAWKLRRARFVVVTDAPALPPAMDAADDAAAPVASAKRPARQ